MSLSSRAQIGSGWTPDNETYTPQTSSGTSITAISGGYEFKIPTETGLCRAEMRGNNLPTNTTNQWQGLGTLVSFPSGSNKICMHQVFGDTDPTVPDLILDEATGGPTGVEIMSLEQSDAVEASIQVGVQFQLNTIYDPVGNLITIYVNGSQTGTKVPNPGTHYNKFGQYVSESGAGPSTFDWVNVQSWSGGKASGGGTTTVATPTFSVAAGTYTAAQTVAISDSTSGATIYYTTNGNTPTTSSTVYSGAISVGSTMTIEAMAAESGDTNSAVASAVYTINLPPTQVATPTFSVAAGTYTAAQTVAISDSTSGATIYYTTNGNTPTTSSTVYSGAISVSSTMTIEAMAAKSGDTNSAVASATYTITTGGGTTVATPTFSVAAGTYTAAQTVAISDSTSGATIYYTTNGNTPTTSSTVYSGAISVSSTTTIKALAAKSGDTNSAVASATYTINAGGGTVVATPVLSEPTGTYSKEVHVSITDSTSGASIRYTTDGSTPTETNGTVYTSGTIEFKATTTLKAIGYKSGDSDSAVVSAVYTID
ncbi:MAG: chitobiase/beta-hexosaminidase C-terminal domain-containing protein [Opitutaceae bacterium]